MAVKTWKLRSDSSAGMQVGKSEASVSVATAGDVNGLYVDESGTYLRGKLSIMTAPEQIRVGGLWIHPSGWQQMFPSTMAFPNPSLILSPGLSGIADMTQAVSWVMSMLI